MLVVALLGCVEPVRPPPDAGAPVCAASPCDALPPRPATIACGEAQRASVDVGGAPAWPERLSDLGCFDDVPTLAAAAGLVPYDVAAPLFSEGADKRRWLVIPPGAAITPRDEGDWGFPQGALLLKAFSYTLADGVERPIEVRAMLRAGEAWAFASWAWDEAEADLIRVPPEGRAVTLRVQPEDGGALPWLYPSLLSCEICHRVPEARALGPRTGQLHHVVDYGGVRADQLLAMDEIGLFDPPIGPLDGLPAIVDPYGAAPVEARARAWLHGNCAHCHQPGGFVPPDSTLDLRVTTPLAEMDACGARKHAGYTTPGEELIVPGDASASHLVQRLLVTGYEKMPPDGAVRVDDAGVGAVTAWIQGLRACP